MTTQVVISEDYGRNSLKKMVVHETEVMTVEARLASSLIERWGLVAAFPDGEDSAGRAKLRMPTPDELVSRACEMSATALGEYRKRGWMVEAPDASELMRKTDD